ncbi:unnamed protein product [Tilletia controversa]|nr:unnamed protein product [Tilletia controversa]
MSTFRNLSNNKSIRQPTVPATVKSTIKAAVKPNNKTIVPATIKPNNKTTGPATGKSIRQPTVLATVKSNDKAKSIRQPTVLATVIVCNEATNIITDQSIDSLGTSEKNLDRIAADAATKKPSESYGESKSSLVAIDNDAISLLMMRTEQEKIAMDVSAVGDAVRSIASSDDSDDDVPPTPTPTTTHKEEDELHITKEVPLTWPNGPIPSILVTGPTDTSSTSDGYHANMPELTSPDFLQVPGTELCFYNVPSLSTRRSPRKPKPFRANLGDAELADASLVDDESELLFITSLEEMRRNFDVLPAWEKVEVSNTAASVEEKSTPPRQSSPPPTSTDSLAPTATMTGPFTSGWRPILSTRTAKATLVDLSSIASKKTSIGSSKAKFGRKSLSSSPFQTKPIGSGKAAIERKPLSSAASKIKSIGSSKTITTEGVSRSSTRRAAPRT